MLESLGDYGLQELIYVAGDDYPEYRNEAFYCIKNNKSLLDFDCWVEIEKAIGEHISYENYSGFDGTLDNCILEYPESEIRELYRAWENERGEES